MPETSVTLRPRLPSDEPFLFGLYCAIKEVEFAALPLLPEQKAQIFRMQYDLQGQAYAGFYPGSDYQVIEVGGEPVGRIWVARSAEELHLADIGVMPAAQGRGIGTLLLKQLQAEAAASGKPIRCNVHRENPGSLRFHQRLGFQIDQEDETDLRLEWRPV